MAFGWWLAGAAGGLWIGFLLLRRPPNLPPGDDDGTLVRLVEAGSKIEAIRRYRARQGGGLKEAKEAVESLARGGKVEPPRVLHLEASADIEAMVREGRHLDAIKAYREAHPGTHLTAATAAVDQVRARLNP